MSLCQWDPLNIWEPATKVSLWRFFLRVLLLIVRRNGHKEVVKVWSREETIFPLAFWFLNLEIWLWKRLSFASTRPKRPMGGRPSRILGQGYSRAGTFYCVIYSVINRERVVQSFANNRSKFTNEKFFIREGILRKKCCSFGFCPNEGGGALPKFLAPFQNVSKKHFRPSISATAFLYFWNSILH